MGGAEAHWTPSERRQALAKQFDEAKLTVIGVQESRTRFAGICRLDPYLIVRSAATAGSDYGCELWMHTRFCGDASQVLVMISEPRILLVALEVGREVFVCVAHAPCIGGKRTRADVDAW